MQKFYTLNDLTEFANKVHSSCRYNSYNMVAVYALEDNTHFLVDETGKYLATYDKNTRINIVYFSPIPLDSGYIYICRYSMGIGSNMTLVKILDVICKIKIKQSLIPRVISLFSFNDNFDNNKYKLEWKYLYPYIYNDNNLKKYIQYYYNYYDNKIMKIIMRGYEHHEFHYPSNNNKKNISKQLNSIAFPSSKQIRAAKYRMEYVEYYISTHSESNKYDKYINIMCEFYFLPEDYRRDVLKVVKWFERLMDQYNKEVFLKHMDPVHSKNALDKIDAYLNYVYINQ